MFKGLTHFVLFLSIFVLIVRDHADAEARKIGVIGPLSGPVASWGNDARNALEFAREKFPNQNIEVVYEDDQCLGKNAVSAAHKLQSVDHVDVVFVICTEALISVAPIFENGKTLVITPVASGPAVSELGDYIFRMWPSDQFAAEKLHGHIAQKSKFVGMLTEERGYPQEFEKAFLKTASSGPLKVDAQTFSSDTTDYRTLLLKVRRKGVDALFLNTGSDKSFVAIIKQLHELKWSVPIYGAYMPASAEFVKLAGPLAEGIEYVDAPTAATALNPGGMELYREFEAKYGAPQSSPFVFASTVEAYRRVGALTPDKSGWRDELYSGKFTGIIGAYSFDKKGDIQGVGHVMMRIVSGKPVLLPDTQK